MQGIFLDRDGVINKERADYVKSWDEFRFLPGTFTALRVLAQLNLPIFIITNQSAIGRQIISKTDVDSIHQQMLDAIAVTGLQICEIFICPHHPTEGCLCRKPAPGMLITAAKCYDLDLFNCVFIGDSITDYLAAQSCGCGAILLRSGRQGKQIDALLHESINGQVNMRLPAVPVFDDLLGAARHLVNLNC